MAVSVKHMSLLVITFGMVSFILGILAEHKKPVDVTPVSEKGMLICKYPKDPTVALGSLSAVFLLVSSVFGYISIFYPYQGMSVPQRRLFSATNFVVFFNIAMAVAGLALAFLIWATIQEQQHLTKNVHQTLETSCPTAKTGLFGGAAFLSLDASLLWLVTLMLAGNVRADYFEEFNTDDKPVYA